VTKRSGEKALWGDSSTRVGGRIDENVIVAYVIGEAVKHDRLVEHVVERCLDAGFVHHQIVHPQPNPAGRSPCVEVGDEGAQPGLREGRLRAD
jgi:hypothetical protein